MIGVVRPTACTRCGSWSGSLDEDGELRCLACSRPRTPQQTLPIVLLRDEPHHGTRRPSVERVLHEVGR